LPELSFEGSKSLFLTIGLCWLITIPTAYYIIGTLNGFDRWGLYGVSVFCGAFAGLWIAMVISLFTGE